ncbi:hypothetical protein COCNU_12G002110 [Cocos nucifera]|uniref:Longin domain-containing protein n=1 Tax=Cocos nucifera TaxID=13894 RepID=A0A8K0NAF0_COCNU|nr:hypothetical protein COCNU_12G002110 [Cocos nucifera]
MGEGEEKGWFIYSFVARGTMVLAEYTEYTGNFPAIATQCLQKLPSSNNKFTYACDHHTFNFLVHDGYGIIPTYISLSQKVDIVVVFGDHSLISRGFLFDLVIYLLRIRKKTG